MAHIYLYSPAGAVRDKAAFRRGLALLKAWGHEVEVDAMALASWQRFAGDDDSRLAAIGRAATSGADVTLISRGGYGLSRLLDRLPYRAIARSIERGTAWVGLSDFTALQMALLAKTGAATWAGPALVQDLGRPDGPDSIMQACFEDLLLRRSEGTGWRVPSSEAGKKHVRDALLWGGNLTMLASLLGTPYFPQVRGGILFLEDVGDHPYRLERTLLQLLHAGVLGAQKAIVLGQFTEYKTVPHDRGFNWQQVIQHLRSRIKTPIWTGLPFGHVPTKVILPVGRKIDLLLEERELMLLWGHEADHS